MTTPLEARALLAAAHTVMSPKDIAEHSLALAQLVATLDDELAATRRLLGLRHTSVDVEFPDAFGRLTISSPPTEESMNG